MKKVITTTIFLIAIIGIAFGHGNEDHNKKKKKTTIEQVKEEVHSDGHSHNHEGKMEGEATLDDFPTLHPLVVHFPIVLLLFAALSQILSFFIFKEQLSWVTIIMLLVGVIGAYVAGEFVHPHTSELSSQAQWVLEEHEEYADFTIWFGFAGLTIKIISHFFLKRLIWAEAVATICLIGAAYSVSKAGHYGAQLTHIEKVEIETGEHNHQH
jgi:uncharacterized membrane protein